MYDLEGADSIANKGREWIEIWNNSSTEVNLSGWKFNDGDTATNHGLNEPPVQGLITIPSDGYAILAVDAPTFLSDHQNYNGTIIDILGVNSLNNTGATLKLLNSEIIEIYSVTYATTTGANGDGNSLQYVNGNWVAAAPTPGATNAGVSQGSQPQSQEPQPQTQQSSTSTGGGSPYIPPEKLPKIKVYAGEDKRVTVGATTEFKGQAFGLEDEPLDNARFLWTFGDGASKEGKNITHFYQYPGEYIVVLNVSSGEYFASDSMLVKALPNQIFISEIKTGADSWIELENKSKEEIDISGSQIKYENQIFVFPQSTRIRPSAYLIIPSSVSGMIFYPGKGVVELLYPGGFKADSFSYNGFLQDNQTFNRLDAASPEGSRQGGTYGAGLIGLESPAAKNLISGAAIKTAVTTAPKKEESVAAGAKNTSDFSDNSGAGAGVATNTNEAAIIISQDSGSKNIIYLLAAFGVAVFGAIVFLFICRKRGGEHF